jgi:S1-C subfamily serine protease
VEDYQRHSAIVVAIGALGLANLPAKLSREGMRVQRGFGGSLPAPGAVVPGRVLGVTVDDEAVIEDVVAGSRAAKAGLREGDRIISIGDVEISAAEEIGPALRGGPVTTKVTVERAGKRLVFGVTFAQ